MFGVGKGTRKKGRSMFTQHNNQEIKHASNTCFSFRSSVLIKSTCPFLRVASLSFNVEQLVEYVIIGRKLPTPGAQAPPLFKMTIYAPNIVVAKSRFWYFLSQLHKVKKLAGEIVSITTVSLYYVARGLMDLDAREERKDVQNRKAICRAIVNA
jgi:hypothetical protein